MEGFCSPRAAKGEKEGAVQKEKFAVVEVLVRRREATTRYSVNGHYSATLRAQAGDRLNDRSH